jgi:hypothetical protein
MKNDVRSKACEIAKRLAKESGIPGDKPNRYMKQAWAEARAEKAPEVLKFWSVEYKMLRGGTQRAIVGASTKEAAAKKFNNPDEIGGPRAEIKGVTAVKKIPATLQVTVVNSEGIPVTGRIAADLDVEAAPEYFQLNVKGKVHHFPLHSFLSATKPPKENVINATSR